MKVSATAARSLIGSMLGTLALVALVALVTEGHSVSGQGGGLLVAGVGGRLPTAVTPAPLSAATAIPAQPDPTPGPEIPATAAATTTAAHASLLPWPFHITAEFGHYPKGGAHFGLDLDATYGVIQTAPVGGVVEDVLRGCVEGDPTCGSGWGNHIWWKSAETGHHILLAHFSKLEDWVQVGATVTAGQAIGVTGATGFASGPHAHLQVNPERWGADTGSTNPAWEFPWMRDDPEPILGARFGACVSAPCK